MICDCSARVEDSNYDGVVRCCDGRDRADWAPYGVDVIRDPWAQNMEMRSQQRAA